MSEVKSLDQLALVLNFLIPGFVALFVRAQFLTGKIQASKTDVVIYFAISVVWWGFILTLLPFFLNTRDVVFENPVPRLLTTFLGPSLLGIVLGLNASFGWSRQFLSNCGLHIVHVMPTAWDWKFGGGMPHCWVMITLKDGTRFQGYCGNKSFVSSDPKERDIYIEKIYSLGEDNAWVDQGDKSVLVPHGEIRSIEFWPYRNTNDKATNTR